MALVSSSLETSTREYIFVNMPEVAVIILNWNGKHFLKKYLPTLIKHTPKAIADIIIADNGSTDQSLNWLRINYPEVTLIELGENFGFAGGYNRAIESCPHKFILLLNSDVEVTPGWLEPLLNTMNNMEIGAVMPDILSTIDNSYFEYAGASGGFIDKYGYPFCRGRIFDHVEKNEGQYKEEIEIHWTSGACMLVRRDVFVRLGGFDADFFAHMEEIDLCWRIRRDGLKLLAIPDSEVYHVGGGTLPNESATKLYLNYRNNLYLLFKNLPEGKIFSTILIRMILDGVSVLKYLALGKFSFIGAIFKAHKSFFSQIKNLRKKRAEYPVSDRTTINLYPKSIVFQFFLRGKKKFNDLDYK